MTPHSFSVDVEGFCEGMAESFSLPADMIRSPAEQGEVAANVDQILEMLDTCRVKGTFFILGIIAEQQPDVVRRIANAGHEIASHSYEHLRLYNMPPQTAKEVISRSKKVLEDVSGKEVLGFRAPDFSITRETIYLLDSIRDAGFLYDSSVQPISGHDVYGIKHARREIHSLPNGLIEFPPATFKVLGKVMPILGGGYFRLFPLWISKAFLRSKEAEGCSAMFYTHPYEVGSVRPIFESMPMTRKFRHYINIEKTKQRIESLFKDFSFSPAFEVLKSAGFL